MPPTLRHQTTLGNEGMTDSKKLRIYIEVEAANAIQSVLDTLFGIKSLNENL